jgi:hypothetical protein
MMPGLLILFLVWGMGSLFQYYLDHSLGGSLVIFPSITFHVSPSIPSVESFRRELQQAQRVSARRLISGHLTRLIQSSDES